MDEQHTFEALTRKYGSVLDYMRREHVRLTNLHVHGGKLFIRAGTPSEDVKEEILEQLERIDPSTPDVETDLNVIPNLQFANPQAATTYVVQKGDTLQSIAEKLWGKPDLYPRLVGANSDTLHDERAELVPGEVLKVPA